MPKPTKKKQTRTAREWCDKHEREDDCWARKPTIKEPNGIVGGMFVAVLVVILLVEFAFPGTLKSAKEVLRALVRYVILKLLGWNESAP